MTSKTSEKIVVIGSGPAGWSAAIYAARAGLKPLLFEGALSMENQEAGRLPMGQLTTTGYVENYPGFPRGNLRGYMQSAVSSDRLLVVPDEVFERDEIQPGVYGSALMELMRAQAEDFGTRVVSEDVVAVDFTTRPFALRDSNGDETLAETVVVATGASARWLGLPSEERFKNNGVSGCAVCDGALPRFQDRPIVVVGGGDSAVEEALYLTNFASKVMIVHRRDELRASKIIAERALRDPQIEILWNRRVEEILGDDENGVTGVRLASASTPAEPTIEREASGVFVAIGRRPNVEFLNGALELDENGCIKRTVPFATNTSVPGVFVAGDVADSRYRQGIVAAGSGACAALDAERFLLEQASDYS